MCSADMVQNVYYMNKYYFTNTLSAFSGEQMYWQECAGNKFKTPSNLVERNNGENTIDLSIGILLGFNAFLIARQAIISIVLAG